MPLKLYRRRNSPNWYIRGTVRGLPLDESTKTSKRDAAEAIRIQREAELLERSIHGRSATATFLEAAVIYLEGGGEKRYVQPLLDHFGSKPLIQIDQAAIDQAARTIKPKASDATRNRQVYTPMAAILHHAAKRGLTEYRQIERPRPPKGKMKWLRPAEAEQLIAACNKSLRPLVIFLLGTGARLSEALYLDWADVDLQARRVWFTDTKNGEARGVPLNERVLVELANLKHRRGTVFRRPDGRPYERKKDGGGQIKTAWAGACRRAGFATKHKGKGKDGKVRAVWKPDFTPHDCRHTWASWFYGATRDIRALMELGGWKSEKMVMRYTHLNPDHLTAAIDTLPWQDQEKSGKQAKGGA